MRGAEASLINGFLTGFARRQAERTLDLPGGFAALDDTFHRSRGDNQVVIDRPAELDPEALPALAERALGHLPSRLVGVLDDAPGLACAEPMRRAGYEHCALVVMLHTGPVPRSRSRHRR
ncbi:hypothetical protein [Streptomyces sp. G-G2]|uniref:hypothetical protein n=1 Tax=Streptomyces sp. G-G2 TaxID=3046201 RepID=UPI0032D95489